MAPKLYGWISSLLQRRAVFYTTLARGKPGVIVSALLLFSYSQTGWAKIPLFRQEDGHTNWQHLANWSAGTFIILLTILSVYLYLARRRANRANRELDKIRRELEQRVRERTANLEQEIDQHRNTTAQLLASESYIQDILTSMPLMLVGLDSEGRVTQWNHEVERVSGIPAAQALGNSLWEVYPTVTVVPDHIRQAIETNEPIHLKQSLRGLAHFDITIYPLHDSNQGVVILVDDVSKQTSAENMLIHNDKMSFMGELASSMAHDINLPLQGLLMDLRSFDRLLSKNRSGDGAPNFNSDNETDMQRLQAVMEDMSSRGEQVSKIVSNLLNFARGRHEKRQVADVPELLDHTLQLASEVIPAAGGMSFQRIKLEKQYDQSLPLVPCYVTELQQVFLSLLRHASWALQRKNQNGFEPRIKLVLMESFGNLWFKLSHNGVGLTEDEQMVLFEPFFSNNESADDFDAGKHLSFSYYIVTEQHRGHMAVTSDLEQGSTIHIQIPIRRVGAET
ncbi:PAS domain-containing protein [Motiliproteus coralliicola]|uniref:histidine kinase n=1 Tax=Motiliproteus coralliicola TaxID=2283196 RepID=A0A369WX47_9GAMM|nr:PAS domain-containing protein [Motiliproteus coralliicola]RDE25104.1 PAS domain-containing protein [Motiliproteus coralliicola]